jgi:hypothetical protein
MFNLIHEADWNLARQAGTALRNSSAHNVEVVAVIRAGRSFEHPIKNTKKSVSCIQQPQLKTYMFDSV